MTQLGPAAAVLAAGLFTAGCSAGRSSGGDGRALAAADASAARTIDAKAANMTKKMTCEEATRAIRTRQFVGWSGLPDGCSSMDLFEFPPEEARGGRRLGKENAFFRVLDLEGYSRPTVSIRDEIVVLFDGAYPQLDGGWDALRADLGEPAERSSYKERFVTIPDGEWVYPDRGITVFLDSEGSKLYHVAVFAPTTLDDYQARLRPDYETTRLPRRGAP